MLVKDQVRQFLVFYLLTKQVKRCAKLQMKKRPDEINTHSLV